MSPITYDRDLFRTRMAILQQVRWAKKVLAYAKCVRETGGDWSNPDCMRLVWPVGHSGGRPRDPGVVEELLAAMPEDLQEQVAASLMETQERLIGQYSAEAFELMDAL